MKLEKDFIYEQIIPKSLRDEDCQIFIQVTHVGQDKMYAFTSKMLYLSGQSAGAEVDVKSTVDPDVYTKLGHKKDYPELFYKN